MCCVVVHVLLWSLLIIMLEGGSCCRVLGERAAASTHAVHAKLHAACDQRARVEQVDDPHGLSLLHDSLA